MSDLFCFLDGFGSGGPLNKSILIVSVPVGSMVTATLGPQIKTAQEKNGEAWLRNLDVGEWNLKLTLGEQSATAKYNIERFGVYRTSMAFFAATIKITYPAGSTCTCSKDDRTYTAPDTSGAWDCVVDSAGDWTVTITADGEEPVSEVVNISENGETKEIVLDYIYYFFKEGTGLASGINIIKKGSVSATATNDNIKITATDGEGAFGLDKAYDVTRYNTLVIDLEAIAKSSDIGISTSVVSGSDITFAASYHFSDSLDRQTLNIDISSVQGDAYIAYHDAPYRTADLTIYNIYLTR